MVQRLHAEAGCSRGVHAGGCRYQHPFPRDAADRTAMTAHPFHPAGSGMGHRWLAPAVEMAAVASGNWPLSPKPGPPGLDVPPACRHPHARRGHQISPRSPGLHPRQPWHLRARAALRVDLRCAACTPPTGAPFPSRRAHHGFAPSKPHVSHGGPAPRGLRPTPGWPPLHARRRSAHRDARCRTGQLRARGRDIMTAENGYGVATSPGTCGRCRRPATGSMAWSARGMPTRWRRRSPRSPRGTVVSSHEPRETRRASSNAFTPATVGGPGSSCSSSVVAVVRIVAQPYP